MYRAFIVDDDAATRDGLKNYFNWAKYDVEIIGDAPDGDVAYEQVLDLKQDILVSDVKMPHMDGTVLLQKLSAAGLRLAVLFISDCSEVALVKSAIRFGASDYIFKPLDLSELEAAVSRIINRLRDDSARLEKLSKMEAQLRRSMPLLRDRYFLGLLNNGGRRLLSGGKGERQGPLPPWQRGIRRTERPAQEDFRKQNEAINSVFKQSTLEGLKRCLAQYFRDTVHSFCQRQGDYVSKLMFLRRRLWRQKQCLKYG